jgi:hypothetical protein
MAWTNSKIFRPFLAALFQADALTGFAGLDADACKVALYDNSITPDNDVTLASSAYSAGVWSTTGGGTGTPQVFQAGQWAQGGVAIAGNSLNSGTADIVFFDATDTASGTAATLSNVFGCLVYDDPVTAPTADIGVSYNYFGGTNAVTNGQLTVVWNANGIFRVTL